MPKKVLGKQVGTVHKVEEKLTFGEILFGAFLVFLLFAWLSA